jgi:molecular chaperone GrpE
MADNDLPDTEPIEVPKADAAASEVEALRARLAAVEQDLHNHKLRLADFENARKRLLRDSETEKKYATEPLARDILSALDNLDRALAAAKKAGDSGPLATGVAATAAQFLEIFRRHGITRIDCGPGTPFDPSLHEAVMQQPSADFPPGHVVQVLQQGFLLHDRVLRPASVIVSANL